MTRDFSSRSGEVWKAKYVIEVLMRQEEVDDLFRGAELCAAAVALAFRAIRRQGPDARAAP